MIVVYPANTTLPSPRANTIQILHTARELAAQGVEVHLVARRGTASAGEILDYYGVSAQDGLHLHLVPRPRIFRHAKVHESMILKKTVSLLRKMRDPEKFVFTRDHLFADLLLRLRKVIRFRLVYEAHTLFFITAKETYMPIAWNETKEARIKRREQRLFQQCDAVVFISRSLQDFVGRHFPLPQRSEVIHDGTVVPAAYPREKEPSVLCYSGQFYLWKGISTLLESMRWVQGAKLRLFGGGYSTVQDDLREMQQIISRYDLTDRVEFCGFVPPSKVPEAISACSVGILPLPDNVIANHCNSPLKLFDYMANGLAVVASDLLTVREIIRHGQNGHLVPPGNPEQLAEGITRLLTDTDYRESLAAGAFRSVQDYSWQKRGEHLHHFLQSL